MKVSAIIVAAGKSERMGGIDKLDVRFNGRTVIEQTVLKFASNPLIFEIIIVVAREKEKSISKTVDSLNLNIPYKLVIGGDTRLRSVKNGISAASEDTDYFCIHDAARPFVSDKLITDTINAAVEFKAAAGGVPLNDTVKVLDDDGFAESTLERENLRAIGTPQVFCAEIFKKALCAFAKDSAYDDCEIVEKLGIPVKIIPGEPSNIKITTQDDIKSNMKEIYRIGYGYDVHRLVEGTALILGGIGIPFEKKLLGHSDADVLVHAIIDALLGAAALGDIGKLFPDTDPEYAGISSLILLKAVGDLLKKEGFSIVNIDSTIVCEKPKLSGYTEEMCREIADNLDINPGKVSVKATTEEGLGFSGKMQGIAAHAITQISRYE